MELIIFYKMFGKDLEIVKYSYLVSSPNLMEYFSIIGYDELTIFKIGEKFQEKLKYKPAILSSISSGQDYGIFDPELIISQFYPENPSFY